MALSGKGLPFVDSMSAQDAAFLRFESERYHMQIASLAILEGPAPSRDEIEGLVAAKLDRVHRFRQRVQLVPLELGQPIWVDAPDFDLTDHLRRTAIPKPGSMDELHALVGRLMSQKLDRSKPLWEMWVVEGLAEDRWAILSKLHHCLADGAAGATLLSTILEPTAQSPPLTPSHWVPRPTPGPLTMAMHAFESGLRGPRRGVRAIQGLLSTPRRAIEELGDFVDGLSSFRSASATTTATTLNGPVGPRRRWHSARFGLADVKKVGRRHDATVNDVVLAAIARGFGRLLRSRGEDVEGRSVRALVPVSIRGESERDEVNNRVAAMVAELPLDSADPAACLETIRAEMARLKEHHQSRAVATISALSAYSPPALLAIGGRLFSEVDQHAIQTVATNVVGPPSSLYAAGRRVLELYPYVPLPPSVRIAVAIASYAGELGFGITGDYESAADIDVLAEAIEDELLALVRTA